MKHRFLFSRRNLLYRRNTNKIQNPEVSAIRGEGYIGTQNRKISWVCFENTLYFRALIFRASRYRVAVSELYLRPLFPINQGDKGHFYVYKSFFRKWESFTSVRRLQQQTNSRRRGGTYEKQLKNFFRRFLQIQWETVPHDI